MFDECCYYLNRLQIPKGYEVDILAVEQAQSMCAGYNEGMHSSDAKYKVYMHQDVLIRNVNFIQDFLNIFKQDEQIGMIGMMGGIGMPKTGVAYLAWNEGLVDSREPDMACYLTGREMQGDYVLVDAIDGLLMITRYDLKWREDLFHHFDFYDVSQSFEMRRAGYKIAVPYQKEPWVVHASSFAKLANYDLCRQIALREYAEFFTESNGFELVYHEEWEQLGEKLAKIVRELLDQGAWDDVAEIIASYRKNRNMRNSELELYAIFSDIYQNEQQAGVKKKFFEECGSFREINEKYMKTRFLIWRMELMEDEMFLSFISEGQVSFEVVLQLLLHAVVEKESVLQKICDAYMQCGMVKETTQVRELQEVLAGKGVVVAYTKRVGHEMNI